MKHFPPTLVLLLIFISCREPIPKLTEQDMKFAEAIANVYLANAAADMIEQGSKDSARRIMITRALKLTDMDTAFFNAQLEHYGNDPPRFKIIYDSSTAILERVQKQKLAE